VRWLVVVAFLGGCDVIFRIDRLDEPPPITGRWSQVAAGKGHTCAIDLDGRLFCWGLNEYGELGRESTQYELDEVQQIGDKRWRSIVTGYQLTCGIQTDDSLWCWGNNATGAFGDGTTVSSATPKRRGGTWKSVSATFQHTCAIASDDALWCWGRNDGGQVGIGTDVLIAAPSVLAIASPRWVSAGATSTCAIDVDGALWCWGQNDNGQLGNGAFSAQPERSPIRIGSDQWQVVDVDAGFACGITAGGRLRCWGTGAAGQLGDGMMMPSATPMAVLVEDFDRTDWVEVAAGNSHACARTAAGQLYCWGNSSTGQLGRDGDYAVPTPIEITGELPWAAVATGESHTCAIAADRSLFCMGGDGSGQLGDGGTSLSTPTPIAGDWQSVSSGRHHTCALDRQGHAFCAGFNYSGELGDGTRESRDELGQVGSDVWTSIAPGTSHTCGINAGNAWCWGSNYFGQLGTGMLQPSTTPVFIRDANEISASLHTCALSGNGLFSCWGLNTQGQVGNGSTAVAVPMPYQYTSAFWLAIATGEVHTCAADNSNGTISCWGSNTYGQLGLGHNNSVTMPSQTTTRGIQIAAGASHTCVVQSTGDAYCWGANYDGQLALPDLPMTNVPTKIPDQWSMLAAGSYHTCGIRLDNTLWCWGSNNRGQLGDGTRTRRTTPQQVGTDKDWVSVSAGAQSTCAIKDPNALLCWGDNNFGQLANGDAWRTSLVRVP
jgi:alpha-tubulin suppressor-like RCC1 family protein